MPILKVGSNINIEIKNLKAKVLRAFVYNDGIYYIIGYVKKGTPLQYNQGPVLGILNVDGSSCNNLPEEVLKRAENIITAHKIRETWSE